MSWVFTLVIMNKSWGSKETKVRDVGVNGSRVRSNVGWSGSLCVLKRLDQTT